MPFKNSKLRLIIGVASLLAFAFVATGFVTKKYRQERRLLGLTHYERGVELQRSSDVDEAVEEFRKALIFSPDSSEYRLSFASALIEAGRLEEAESHIEQLLQEDPTNGQLNLMQGHIAEKRGQTTKAIEFYQRAVYEYWPPKRIGERRQARLELIDLLAKAGRREELIGELMTLYANFPDDQGLKARVGLDLLDHGATLEATQVFRELVRAAPKNAEAHRGLAQAYFASGDYVSARHEFERALRINVKDTVSSNELKLTNSIIDLDPNLRGIRDAERLRRAQNLLRRVIKDLEQCGTPETTGAALANAKKLLNAAPSKEEDLALDTQQAAIDLWARRSQLCAGKPNTDALLATVLARISSE